MARKYVALAGVDYLDADGKRALANPARKGQSGIFSADYTEKQEKRLIDKGAIRRATNKDVADDAHVVDDELDLNDDEDAAEDLNALTPTKLKALAKKETIDLGDAVEKDDLIAKIISARAASKLLDE